MNKLQNNISKISITAIFIAAVFMGSETLAQTTLNGVEISSSLNSRGYDIVLNTDKGTTVNKKNVSANNLELNLKNTKVSKNASTVYKNADGIEHVILKPKANNLKIEISGNQAGNSNVELASAIAENTVFINKPLKSYAPIHQIEEETTASSFSLIALLKSIKNSPALRSLFDSSNIGWLFSFVMMFGLLIATNNRNRQRNQIDLKINSAEDTENKILKAALERKEGLIAQGIGSRRTSLMQPKPEIKSTNIQNTNYGLRAYNNQPKTPSTNTTLRSSNIPLRRSELNNIQPTSIMPERKAINTATKSELRENILQNEVHIDNVKFLESMAKIYERSGRVDLANGLANNIKRAKNKR